MLKKLALSVLLLGTGLAAAADPVPTPPVSGPKVTLVPAKERKKLEEYPTTVGVPVEISSEDKDVRGELASESPSCYYTVSGGVCSVVANAPGRYIVACFGPTGPATLRVINVGGIAPAPPGPGPVIPPVKPPVDPSAELVKALQTAYDSETATDKAKLLKDMIEVYSLAQTVTQAFTEATVDGKVVRTYDLNTVSELAAKVLDCTKLALKDMTKFLPVRRVLAAELKSSFPPGNLTETSRADAVKKFAGIQAALEKVK